MCEVTRVTQGRSTRCPVPSHLFQQGVSLARLHSPWRCPASQRSGPGPAAARASSSTLFAQPNRFRNPRSPASGSIGAGSRRRARGWKGGGEGGGPRDVARRGERHSPPPDTRARSALRETTSDGDDRWAVVLQWRRPALPASRSGPESAPEGAARSNSGRGDARGVLAQDRAKPAVSAEERGCGRRTQPGL